MNSVLPKILLASTILIFSSCIKSTCKNEPPSQCHLMDLSNHYEPVCGCDKNTYQNEAHAICSGIEDFKKGKCKNN